MKQVLIRRGDVVAADVPAPVCEPGTAIVAVLRSCISVGTELSGLKRSGMPVWQLATKYPEQARKAIQTVATLGLTRTWGIAQDQLSAARPAGYSAAGIVLQVGQGIEGIKPGDRVACAGAQCANHAEIIRVPQNLMTPIPEGVGFDEASTVTLGAIAMQGVRRAQPTLGETFVVIGLGPLGQLTTQLLNANGCRVIGVDLDRRRIQMAFGLGMAASVDPEDRAQVEQVARMTGGAGADGVIITAATSSDEVVSAAFQMCRKKGRVVLVGDVGLNLKRADMYQKELDFFISCSYGPGRYDAQYEEGGVDYPIGYVRWTENRNMAEYLRLIAQRRVSVQPLIAATYPVESAPAAYEALQAPERPMLVLLSYANSATPAAAARRIPNPTPRAPRAGAVRMALVGAGGFAKGMHLPNLHSLKGLCHLSAVMSRSGHNAAATARRWGATYCTTDFQEVLADKDIDAVIIATRHHLHASMALEALRAGKHVLLEKPLALSSDELQAIGRFFEEASRASQPPPILLTGFNRRFSPHTQRIRESLAKRSNPMIIDYRMNAGHLPSDHWTLGPEGGGRNLGEACHIYDLFTYLTGARVTGVHVSAITPTTAYYRSNDNFTASISFDDGSIANLTYTALGSKDHAKERLEIFADGKVIALDDYKTLTFAGGGGRALRTRLPEKGQKEELEAFARAIRDGQAWPAELWEQEQATRIALEVESALNRDI
jgi:predicted dehydrogenase/threonine dehydrogenase-like Zn-dependent dehydrogenase